MDVVRAFTGGHEPVSIEALGRGLINDTYLVSGSAGKTVLQRINSGVFPQPTQVIENLLQINRYLHANPQPDALKIPELQQARSGRYWHLDAEDNCWRMLEWVPNSVSRDRIQHLGEAEQIGKALGRFHRMVCQLDRHLLHDTLPGFHITPEYLSAYDEALQSTDFGIHSETLFFCHRFIELFRHKADVLEQARRSGHLIERVIHGDPKLNNFLFARDRDEIISLIDLDTVKPGLVHYDIADCLRSCCYQTHDDSFDLQICQAILAQYLDEAGSFFTLQDYDYLVSAIELLPFELGLRFVTDYLLGNRYFRISTRDQNLLRAASQFRLCQDIGRKRKKIEMLIRQLRSID